jgi:molybdate transport system substrate-binding protein
MRYLSPGRGTLRWLIAASLGLLLSLASADEIHVVSSGGFAAAYRALAPDFERQTGHHLTTAWGPSMGETPQAIPNRLQRGENIDVVIMVGDSLDDLIKHGQVLDADHQFLARSRIGMAVRAGAPKPEIATLEGLKQALLAARSIAYSDSASGVFLSTVLFPRLGIAEQIKDKCRMIPAEPVGQVVARGEAEIGLQQVSELLPVAGIDFVGALPEAAQQITPFSAGIVAGSKEMPAAKALIDYLASPAAAPLIRQTGLDPAHANVH